MALTRATSGTRQRRPTSRRNTCLALGTDGAALPSGARPAAPDQAFGAVPRSDDGPFPVLVGARVCIVRWILSRSLAPALIMLFCTSACSGASNSSDEPTTTKLPVHQRVDASSKEACARIDNVVWSSPLLARDLVDLRTTVPGLLRHSTTPGANRIADRLGGTDISTSDDVPSIDDPVLSVAQSKIRFAARWCSAHGYQAEGGFSVH